MMRNSRFLHRQSKRNLTVRTSSALPLGPRLLFIAANQPALADHLAVANPNELVDLMNDNACSDAQEMVFGVDNS